MKAIYFLRGQSSGVDMSIAFSSHPSAEEIATFSKLETDAFGPNKDGSNRFAQVVTIPLTDGALSEYVAPEVTTKPAKIEFLISGSAHVANP